MTRDAVALGDGRVIPSAVTIWTAGFGVPDLAARSGLRTDAVGRLVTDETPTSVDDPRIVAAGDSWTPSAGGSCAPSAPTRRCPLTPLLTASDAAEDAELGESVSMALMTVLETLSPTERAVFVLREVFDVGFDEIAAAVDTTPAAVRQIAHRAREHVGARRPRQSVPPREVRTVLTSFQRAVETGDLQGLLDVLAPDVVAPSAARNRRVGPPSGGNGFAGRSVVVCDAPPHGEDHNSTARW